MTNEEIKKELLFESHFTIENGPLCHCQMCHLTHFHSFLPDEACGKDITDMVFERAFESDAASICSCQEAHSYHIKCGPEGVTFEEISSEIMDPGKLNQLPNWREY